MLVAVTILVTLSGLSTWIEKTECVFLFIYLFIIIIFNVSTETIIFFFFKNIIKNYWNFEMRFVVVLKKRVYFF